MYKRGGLSFVSLLLAITPPTTAGSTMSNFNESPGGGIVSPTSEAHIIIVRETSQITEPSNSHRAYIGVELLKPPADFIN